MRALFTSLLALALASPSLVARAQEPDVGRLFSHEADVSAAGDPPYRLPLGPEVLAVCQPRLGDVRLYDAGGREIPWLLDSAGRVLPGMDQRTAFRSAPALEATRSTVGPPRTPTGFVESYLIAPPGEAPPRAEWSLVVDVRREAFVAAIRIIERGTDGVERELVSTSVYRMQGPTRERLRFPLPPTSSASLRVEITGQDGYLEPLLGFEATRDLRGATPLAIPLEITDRRASGGQTILVVTRPPGTIPDRLRFSTSTPAFARAVRIDDTTSYAGEIHRVPTVRDAESLEVSVAQLREASFTITIDDGDSPALADLTVEAIVSQPSLVFFEPVALARFGGARVRAPHYDLDALSGSWMIDRLVDGSSTPTDAVLGPVRPSPTWDPSPALAFLHRPGVVVEAAEFRAMAPLTVAEAPEGASRFVLSGEALSALAEDQGDLRIVDGEARQWPYLVTDSPRITLPLAVAAPTREGNETRYALTLPVERASLAELRLVADAALVSRYARVVGIDTRGDEVALGAGTLEHTPGQTEPMSIGLTEMRVTELALIVDDGDEAPLAFSSIEASLVSREIFLVAPPGEYRALLGSTTAHAPTYDIERARELLVAIPPAAATLGAVVVNPAFHEPGLVESAGVQTIALWAVLLLAVLVLGVLTLRASREPAPEAAAPAPADPTVPAASSPVVESAPAAPEAETTPAETDSETPRE
jgi:hypothetical protein